MKTETGKDIYGREFKYMRLTLVKGRNVLAANGFIKGANPLYYSKASEYWHFNKLMGVWIHETSCASKNFQSVA